MKKALLALAFAAFSIPDAAHAALSIPFAAHADRDLAGRIALGYWNREAPIGGRYVISNHTAIDFGFGFEKQSIGNVPTALLPGDPKKNMQLNVAAGAPFTVLRRRKVAFFVRPGVLFKFVPTYNQATPADPYQKRVDTEMSLTGIVGAEWFVTNGFSLSLGHGVELESPNHLAIDELTTGEIKSQSLLSGLQANEVTSVGVHVYF